MSSRCAASSTAVPDTHAQRRYYSTRILQTQHIDALTVTPTAVIAPLSYAVDHTPDRRQTCTSKPCAQHTDIGCNNSSFHSEALSSINTYGTGLRMAPHSMSKAHHSQAATLSSNHYFFKQAQPCKLTQPAGIAAAYSILRPLPALLMLMEALALFTALALAAAASLMDF